MSHPPSSKLLRPMDYKVLLFAKSTVVIVQIYMELVGKHIKKCWLPEDPFFLTREGQEMTSRDLSYCYSRFMHQHLNKHVTTTGYRSLVQTTAEEAMEQGTISPAQRAAFHTINGHSSATCKQFYIRKSAVNAANTAMQAFCKLIGNEAEEVIDGVHICKKSELGTNHSQPLNVNKATWDPEELYEVMYGLVLCLCNMCICLTIYV